MISRASLIVLLVGLGSVFAGLFMAYVPDETLNLSAEYYAKNTADDLGAANIVTAIIVTYRGLDTLGEVTVLFLTATIVGMVLAQSKRVANQSPRKHPPAGELLMTGTRLLLPLILLFGVYVFSHGHLTPGGGFQGGAILASGMLLLLLGQSVQHFSHRLITLIESTAGVAFVVLGLLGLLLAGGFLDNRFLPTGALGELFSAGAIPVIYAFVGLKVGAEFASMLLSLSKTEEL